MKVGLQITASVALVLAQGCATRATVPPSPQVTVAPEFSGGQAIDRVAIYVENRSEVRFSTGLIREIEDVFTEAAIARGYVLAARSDIDRVVQEQKLQASGITEAAVARAAKVLAVPAIILVSVNTVRASQYQPVLQTQGQRYFQSTVSMSARMLSAERANVLWLSSYTGTYRVPTLSDGEQAAKPVAAIVAGGLPQRVR